MVQCKYLLLLCLITGCQYEKIYFNDPNESEEQIIITNEDVSICTGPYFEMIYPKLTTWKSADCTGDFARGQLSNYPCAQYSSGDLYCVDLNQPTDKVYYHNPNNNGKCEEWTLYPEQWYVWKYCGTKPISDNNK